MIWIVVLLIGLTSQYNFVDPLVNYGYALMLDTTSDESITRYVWPRDPLNDLRYRPSDLVQVGSTGFVEWGIAHLKREAYDHLVSMSIPFHAVFKKPLFVVSAYRSYWLQIGLFGGYIESHGIAAYSFSALPWHSEHQLGLAVDLFTADTQTAEGYKGYYDRMKQNAYKRWRTQSYQKGAKTDGYIIEPWHRRYVGMPLAALLHFKRMTFSEREKKYKLVHQIQIVVK